MYEGQHNIKNQTYITFPCFLTFLTPHTKLTRYPNTTATASHSSLVFTEQTVQHRLLDEGAAVQDLGHLVERSEPQVQLIHPNRNTVQFGRWI